MDADHSFVIDTCSLTHLNRTYPLDMFKPVWDKVEEMIESQELISIEEVFIELEAQDDALLDWAKAKRSNGFFKPLSADIQGNAKKILMTHPNLIDLKKSKSSADVFLIALAMAVNGSVITEEKPSGGPQKSKIPDVCSHYSIKCISLLGMLREAGFSL